MPKVQFQDETLECPEGANLRMVLIQIKVGHTDTTLGERTQGKRSHQVFIEIQIECSGDRLQVR